MKIALLCISLFCFIINGAAQFNFGTSNAINAGLGNAATTHQTVFSVIDNQAGLAGLNNLSIGITSQNSYLIEGLYSFTAVAGIPTNSGNFGAGLQYKGYEGYTEFKATVAYGRNIFDNLSIGASFNAYSLNISNYGNTAVVNIQLGLQAQLSSQLLLGAHISNPIKVSLSLDEQSVLPTTITAGLRYQPSKKASVYVEGEKNLTQAAIFKGGIAYELIDNFELLIGASSSVETFTAGVSWHVKPLQIVFAGSYHAVLGLSPTVSILFASSKKTNDQ